MERSISGSLTDCFPQLPVVATFHQPPDLLEKEIIFGSLQGRVGKITHQLNYSRFDGLSAAIVTSSNQINVLEKKINRDKIHHIPLGVHLEELNSVFSKKQLNIKESKTEGYVITVGNWLRDWEFYFKVIEQCPKPELHSCEQAIKLKIPSED